MLKLNIPRVAQIRGISRPFTHLRKNGISSNVANRIVSGEILSISFKHLQILCTIFNCTPHDLIEFIPDKNQTDTSTHPLNPLRKDDSSATITKLLHSLPLDKLTEIAKIINEQKK